MPNIFLILFIFLFVQVNTFKTEQQKNSRVKAAYKDKATSVESLLKKKSISVPFIFIRAFKKEQVVEVWAKEKSKEEYVLITQHEFCTTSGSLGPKRKQGDFQIPEGIYHIDRFNPWSNFYLSLGINYPNSSDRILGNKQNLGGDIFIHGECATIGCIPITNQKIKELYVFAVEAKNNGQNKIPVHIFPSKMEGDSYAKLKDQYKDNETMLSFWANLKEVYNSFETTKTLRAVSVDQKGRYKLD